MRIGCADGKAGCRFLTLLIDMRVIGKASGGLRTRLLPFASLLKR
jgi:hypothetical protein